MTTTIAKPTSTTDRTDDASPAALLGSDPAAIGSGRPRWPLFGLVGAVTGFAALMVSMPSVSEEEAREGAAVLDQLDRGGYHLGFVLGLVSVGCLFVAAQGWKRWAEERAPRDLAARTFSQGLAAAATVNIIFTCLMGSMALYLPGGTDHGWLTDDAMFVNYTLLDFGTMLGWWGAAVSAVSLAVMAFRRNRLVPRWMGVVSVVLLAPALLMAAITALPGFVGLTMPIWLAVVSIGMVFSRTAHPQT